MTLIKTRIRELLRNFGFKELFIQELGWDHHSSHLSLSVANQECQFEAVAHKRGMVAYTCPFPKGASLDYPTRCKLETQVAKSVREHLIIFTDECKNLQIWQWVKREQGKPVARREHVYYASQAGDSLIQKLENLEVTLEEEEEVDLFGVTTKARKAFDVDKVTRKFYDLFKKQHSAFLKNIDGIIERGDREWYASIMLNRLMFTWFIQAKGFLDNDKHYLSNRLQMVQKERGKNNFLSFYRSFLLKLFHDGLGKKKRDAATDKLLGRVPFLNGGVFEIHQLEEKHGEIDIADSAFEKLFDFFDQYEWRLDNRPTRDDREINPDVLGYIFEKYINQKQMGAYYTKEDITEYIGKNTIVPFLFDKARRSMKKKKMGEIYTVAFASLKADPDRYIYDAVRHGADLKLPDEIAEGLDTKKPNLLERRKGWNKSAPPEYALPTEIWREVVARLQRYEEVRQKLRTGKVTEINDLITLNLNIRQFAQDAIENCQDPHFLNAFWKAISEITVLDPTCGSGAFLFAALNILEPLYEACLDRMRAFMLEWSELPKINHTNYYKDFATVLARIDEHANERYFIFKSIIINNLYGVDIMEEAVEICKLRLFLKLAAEVEPDYGKENIGIEPLPDIDFNIRCGNTLVGFVTESEVRRQMTEFQGGQLKLLDDDELASYSRFQERVEIVSRAFQQFRKQQTELGGAVSGEDKRALRKRLEELDEELNKYLATQYGIDFEKKVEYTKWRTSHQPFHWFVEFYGIMSDGGFDVIIGNPPYVEYNKVRHEYVIYGYSTDRCGNLYAYILERNALLVKERGSTGMIVPHSAFCTDRMAPVQKLLVDVRANTWISTYCIRPAKLFVGVDQRLAIYVSSRDAVPAESFSSRYHRWHEEFRPFLLPLVEYANTATINFANSVPKVHCPSELSLWTKISSMNPLTKNLVGREGYKVYFHNAPRYWIRAMDSAPYFWNERDGEQMSSHVKTLFLSNKIDASVVVATLNSSFFYWWFILLSNCRDLTNREIENFPLGLDRMSYDTKVNLAALAYDLMVDFKHHKKRKEAQYKATGRVVYDEFYPKYSKPIMDNIDHLLVRHYGFTDEELDFIINYDIKYRMGDALKEK